MGARVGLGCDGSGASEPGVSGIAGADLRRVAGVLLAAGGGRRYGAPKVLAEGGAWLAAGVRALAEGGCDDILVVLGAAVVPVPAPARAVVNPQWSTGMASSVRRGLEEALAGGADLVVLHLVDIPDVGGRVVRRVVDGVGERGLARASYEAVPGHPLALSADHAAAMLRVLTGDEGGRAYLRGRSDLVLVECGDLASGEDHDSPRREM